MKKFRSYIMLTCLFFGLLMIWSFQESPKTKKELDIQTQVRNAVDKKLANRKKIRMQRCRETALKEAEEMVDSILLAQAKLTVSDTLSKPPKPPKPELLDVKKAKDQTPIKPLFDEKAIEEKTSKIDTTENKIIQ